METHEPLWDIPCNLKPDGTNYVEWVAALLEDGIEVRPGRSFSDLKTDDGGVLIDAAAAAYLDKQLVIATRAAEARGHAICDVVICCKANSIDSTALADELNRQYFVDRAAALTRARAISEICEEAEEFVREAIHLKWMFAGDDQLVPEIRKLFGEPP